MWCNPLNPELCPVTALFVWLYLTGLFKLTYIFISVFFNIIHFLLLVYLQNILQIFDKNGLVMNKMENIMIAMYFDHYFDRYQKRFPFSKGCQKQSWNPSKVCPWCNLLQENVFRGSDLVFNNFFLNNQNSYLVDLREESMQVNVYPFF